MSDQVSEVRVSDLMEDQMKALVSDLVSGLVNGLILVRVLMSDLELKLQVTLRAINFEERRLEFSLDRWKRKQPA